LIEISIDLEEHDDDDPWWRRLKTAARNIMNFGLCGTVGGVGRVWKRMAVRPTRRPDIPTAPEEDKILHDKYSDGESVYYDLWWRNCNHFVAQNQGEGTGH